MLNAIKHTAIETGTYYLRLISPVIFTNKSAYKFQIHLKVRQTIVKG